MLLQNEDAVFQAATETLFKLLQNVIAHPTEPKYRTLRRANASFASNVGSAKGGIQLLKAAGFVEQSEGDDAALVLPEGAGTELPTQAKAALKAVVKHRMQQKVREGEAKRAAENAEAAQKLADLKAVSEKNLSKQTQEAAAERERILKGLQIDRDDLVRQRDPNNLR